MKLQNPRTHIHGLKIESISQATVTDTVSMQPGGGVSSSETMAFLRQGANPKRTLWIGLMTMEPCLRVR